jgi:hypothetical protein
LPKSEASLWKLLLKLRNNFIDLRDADFQRGLNKAVENRWIKIKLRDRYMYELTEAGLAAGLNAALPPKPLG